MRTTVEITAEQRARLLAIAARRGEKGFSHLVREALETYLVDQQEIEEKRKRALKLRGALTDNEGDRLLKATRRIRDSWR